MCAGARKELCWGIGLNEEECFIIQDALGAESVLKMHCGSPTFEEVRREDPVAVFIAATHWARMNELERGPLDNCGKIFILPEDYRIENIEPLFAASCMGVLTPAVDPAVFSLAMERCREHNHARADMRRMSTEIALQREIFMRKSGYLDFVFNFFNNAGECLTPSAILSRAAEGLKDIMPLQALQGVFWNPGQSEAGLDLYIESDGVAGQEKEWRHLLLKVAENMTGVKKNICRLHEIPTNGRASNCPQPSEGKILLAPMAVDGHTFGCLVILGSAGISLGQDQMQLLHAATAHLELSLYNAIWKRPENMGRHEEKVSTLTGNADTTIGRVYF